MVLLMFALISTQDTEAQELPSSGDRTFEITVSPFSGSPVSFTNFRLRQFQSADNALRLRANMSYTSERMDDDNRDSQFSLLLAPGMEWHAFQQDRISIFYGVELPINYLTSREHREDYTNKNTNGNEHFGIGLNGLVGMDVHFLQRLYAGFEVSYGFAYRSYLDGEYMDQDFDNDSSEFVLSSSAVSQFRFGFRF